MKIKPHPIDVHVGKRTKLQRRRLGMSRARLGDLLGVSHHQVQKYEHGTNRIGSSRLHELGQILNVPVSYFFDDEFGLQIPDTAENLHPALPEGADALNAGMDGIQATDHGETLRLLQVYYQITDLHVRKRLLELVKSLGRMEVVSDDADD